ncbi:MAG: Type 1 glutamine amidotransferase-like domain-containing protein [Clostridia bacterium]|nr:Type 1 glutamine amidotransferase-like domain-containing protein [Clostridia bacterium]
MKLILSSCDFKNEKSKKFILNNIPKPLNEIKVLFMPDDCASKKEILSNKFYDRLVSYGFKRENITVLNYYDADSFKNLDIDMLYLSGGNTFSVLHRIRKHGFQTAMIDYIKNGVIYVGGSAGAHIVSANLEHVLKYDQNTAQITDFSGLNLFDGILVCHFTNERQAHFEALKAEGKYKVAALTNDDSLLIEK